MAEPTPTPGKYKRDVGSGEQLASGEATDANASLVEGNAVEAQIAEATDFVPQVQYATSEPPDYQPRGDLESVLFGPPEGLKPPPTPDKRPVPDSVLRALPGLSRAASDPSTPAVIRAAYKYITQRLEAEMKAHGE